jgi:anaerobic selenocysteine-containing dehydrogenase
MRESFGSDGQPGSYTDIDYTDCILMVGHNMAATQTVLWSRILDRLAGPDPPKLIVIDSRKSASARKATLHLAPKIGTNMAILNGIQHLLFENGWVNHAFVSKHVVGLDELRNTVKSYDPQRVEEITGIPAVQILEAARAIGTTRSLLSTVLQGVYQSNQATASACQINNINLLRGLIGKPGSGIYQMNGQPTAQNNREAGCDGEYPGFRNFNNPMHMAELADLWNIEHDKLPHWNQPTHIENLLKYIAAGSIEMFWISGTNPLVSLPNLPKVRELLTKPDLFVVCQDIFMTETAAVADVVLPAAQWGEKTGCFTNVDRTVHISYKAVEPPGEAKSDLEIFVDFARRMDFQDKEGNPILPSADPEVIFEAWKKVSKGRPCDYSGISYEKLTGGSGIQWPCNDKHPNGKERLYDDGIFFTDIEYCESFGHDLETGVPYTKEQYKSLNPAGRAVLKAAEYIAPPELPDENYPLRLSTGRNVYHFHTRTKTGRSKALQEKCPEPYIEISTEDAETVGVRDGDEVIVRSRRGAVQMKVSIGKVSNGETFIPFHFGYWDAIDGRARAANELTTGGLLILDIAGRVSNSLTPTEYWDPVSKQPSFKSGAVRIEKCTEAATVQAKEAQSDTVTKVTKSKPNASDVGDNSPRERHLEKWLGATFEALRLLENMYEELIPKLIQDPEVISGLRVMRRITTEAINAMEPYVEKYSAKSLNGKSSFRAVHDAVLPSTDTTTAYESMVALKGLFTCLADIEAHFIALIPGSQALWDADFHGAMAKVKKDVERMQAWARHQLHVRSPQTLLVPSKDLWHNLS